MNINKITDIKIKIIINNNLYNRKVIDEETFSKVNEQLIKMLKNIII